MSTALHLQSDPDDGQSWCSAEEEALLAQIDEEWAQNFALYQEHRESLARAHHGSFCLVFHDDDGTAQIRVDQDLMRLQASLERTRLASAVLEYLRDPAEVSVPTTLLDDE